METSEQLLKSEQARVLTEGDASECYHIARYVEGADIQALQARMLVIGTMDDCRKFSMRIKGSDTAALRTRIKQLSQLKEI